jgi:hypothetical protein
VTQPKNFADFLTSFSTGWPEDQPHLMILSLTTASGRKDYALTQEQAELISKTMKQTAAQLKKNKAVS